MKISTDKIENFATMTDAEKVEALLALEFDEPKAKDNSIDVEKYKKLINDATAEASKFKKLLKEKESEAETKAREQAEDTEKLRTRLAELERSEAVSKHMADFLKVGYDSDLAKASAEAICDGNFAVIFDNLNTFIQARDESIKADVLKATPSPTHSGGVENTVTKEQFESMGLRERQELFVTNRELYDTLSK